MNLETKGLIIQRDFASPHDFDYLIILRAIAKQDLGSSPPIRTYEGLLLRASWVNLNRDMRLLLPRPIEADTEYLALP